MCHQHIVQKYHTTYIFISSRILFLIIYGFKECIFFIKEVVVLSKILAPLRKMSIQTFNMSIFDTEINRTGNPSTNIWNIL